MAEEKGVQAQQKKGRLRRGFRALFGESHSRQRRIVMWVVGVLVALAVILSYLWAKRYVLYTADAYIEANWVPIRAEVSGYITQVFVEDNQWVDEGAPLFQIDPAPYLYAVNYAQGELDTAIKYEQQLLRQLEVAAAAIEVRKNQLNISQDRLERRVPLMEDDFAPVERVVDLFYTVKKDEASLLEAERYYEEIEAELGPPDQPFSQIVVAEARLDQAQYDLGKTLLTAPTSGRITNFYLRPGQYVSPSDELFAIVDTTCWWATARFKDVAVGNIRAGAPAKIWVDMYWATLFDGYVEGIGWGVNRHQASPLAAPSALPYLEQTEFWIRLSQRFPVRIIITDPRAAEALHIGANCRVFIEKGSREEPAKSRECMVDEFKSTTGP